MFRLPEEFVSAIGKVNAVSSHFAITVFPVLIK